MYILVLFCGTLIYFNHFQFVRCQDLEGVFGKSLTLKWILNLNETIIAANLYHGTQISEDKKLFGSTGSSNPTREQKPYSKTTFGNRISASISKLSYNVTINDLKYSDSGSFLLETYVQSASESYSKNEEVRSISDVKGGPDICGNDIQKSYTYKEGETPKINITLCGVPKPAATFKFNTNGKNEPSFQMINNYTYVYNYQFPKLNQNMCNKTLSFEAVGHDVDKTISRSSIIVLDEFIPTAPSNVRFSRIGNCTKVKWDPIDTGNCKVDYVVEFFSNSILMSNKTIPVGNTLDICSPSVVNASGVIVFAIYMGRYNGEKSVLSPLLTTPPPTTTTTATPETTPKGGGSFAADDDEGSSTPMIIGIVCGIFFLLLLVVLVAFLVKRKKKNDDDGTKLSNATEDMELKRPVSYQDEGDYASVGGIYAELGKGGRIGPKPVPIESNYSEVKIDESGYPAVGPTSDLSKERPNYSTTVNRDRSRRHSLSADIEDNSEVIV